MARLFGKVKVGLALGGGAARGLAHVGVLRVLEEHGIPVHMIVGTSIGALVGGLYASTKDVDETEQRLVKYLDSDAFRDNRFDFLREMRGEPKKTGIIGSLGRWVRRGIFIGYSLSRSSFVSAQQFERNVNHLLDDIDIRETKIPFTAVTCDIRKGEEVLVSSGSIRKAVSASSAIPGILPPITQNGRVLVDGGWTSKVPILPAFKMGADVVIAVDISAEIRDTKRLTRGYDIFVRASSITDSILKRMQCRMADVLIRPKVGEIHWADFSRSRECIERGAVAARESVKDIQAVIRQERLTGGLIPTRGRRLARYYLGTRLQAPPKE